MNAKTISIVLLTFTATLMGSGCGKGEDYRDLRAANERIRTLQTVVKERTGDIDNLRSELMSLRAERDAALAGAGESHRVEVERLKATYDAQILATRELFQQRIADLESAVADLQIRLGLSEKERLAQASLLDQPGRLESVHRNNHAIERLIWMVLVLVCLAMSGFFAFGYFGRWSQRRNAVAELTAHLARR